MRGEAVAVFREAFQRRVALDGYVVVFEAVDQQPFVFVLRVHFQKGIGCQAFADPVQRQLRHGFALDPEIRRGHPMAVAHHCVG